MGTGRLDKIITQLERLQSDASEIIDAHVTALHCQYPPGTSWGATKAAYIFPQAGSQLNFVKALKFIRQKYAKEQHGT